MDVDAGRETPPTVEPDLGPVSERDFDLTETGDAVVPEPVVPEQAKSPDQVTKTKPAVTEPQPEAEADAKAAPAAEATTEAEPVSEAESATEAERAGAAPSETEPVAEPETEAADEPAPDADTADSDTADLAAAAEPVADTAEALIPPPRRRSTSTRVMYGVGRSVIALTAAAVLAVTGYNWSILHQLDQGIARTDVFDNASTVPTGGQADGNAPVLPPPLTTDQNILLVGMDSRTDPHGNPLPANELAMLHAGPDTGELDTDTMILLHIPAGGQQAVAISFPRDSFVQLAGGFGTHRLNSAFAYAHNAEASKLREEGQTNSAQIEQEADTAGRKNLIATIEQLIGNSVTINRYAEINLAGFYDMAKAVGGVQVCLKAATHDSETDASFPAGVQTLYGVQALNFVRQRHGLPNGDLDRIVRQQVFLGALANKVLSTGTLTSPSRIAALTTAMQNSITLSSGWDIASFAEQMQNLSSGAIQFNTIPTGPNITVGGADVTQIDPADVQRYVTDLVNTTNTLGAADETTTPPPTTTGASGPSRAPTVTTTTPPPTTPTVSNSGPITANGLRCVN